MQSSIVLSTFGVATMEPALRSLNVLPLKKRVWKGWFTVRTFKTNCEHVCIEGWNTRNSNSCHVLFLLTYLKMAMTSPEKQIPKGKHLVFQPWIFMRNLLVSVENNSSSISCSRDTGKNSDSSSHCSCNTGGFCIGRSMPETCWLGGWYWWLYNPGSERPVKEESPGLVNYKASLNNSLCGQIIQTTCKKNEKSLKETR